jgi:hypothetical protein
VVQVETRVEIRVETRVESAWFQRSQLKYDSRLLFKFCFQFLGCFFSSFAFNFNLWLYTQAAADALKARMLAVTVGWCELKPVLKAHGLNSEN